MNPTVLLCLCVAAIACGFALFFVALTSLLQTLEKAVVFVAPLAAAVTIEFPSAGKFHFYLEKVFPGIIVSTHAQGFSFRGYELLDAQNFKSVPQRYGVPLRITGIGTLKEIKRVFYVPRAGKYVLHILDFDSQTTPQGGSIIFTKPHAFPVFWHVSVLVLSVAIVVAGFIFAAVATQK